MTRMQDEVLATVRASAPRRAFAVCAIFLLGVLLIYLAISEPSANPALQILLVVMGLVAIWLGEQLRRATTNALELTRSCLRDSRGVQVARIDQIETLDRGMFAFKPSNGFILKLKARGSRQWQPGLWWRVGRRVGVGGVTSAAQTKAMAELIAVLKAEREAGPPE